MSALLAFDEALSRSPKFGAACYAALRSWGYTFEEAKHEGLVWLFETVSKGVKLDHPQAVATKALPRLEMSRLRRKQAELEIVGIPGGYEQEATAAPLSDSDFFKLLKGIPAERKEAIYFHRYLGYSIDETSRILGVELNTVKTRVHRGCKQLKGRFDNG